MHDQDNDGRFPDQSPVEIRDPRNRQEEQGGRGRWPWLSGTIVEQCDPDEWYLCIDVRGAPPAVTFCYPCCFRDSSEIRPQSASGGPAAARCGVSQLAGTG
jgi:hypothetical protein